MDASKNPQEKAKLESQRRRLTSESSLDGLYDVKEGGVNVAEVPSAIIANLGGVTIPLVLPHEIENVASSALVIGMVQSDVACKPDGTEIWQVAHNIAVHHENRKIVAIELTKDGQERVISDDSDLERLKGKLGNIDIVYVVGHHYDSQACAAPLLAKYIDGFKKDGLEIVLVSCNSANYRKELGRSHEYSYERSGNGILFLDNLDEMPDKDSIFTKVSELLIQNNIRGNVFAFNSFIFADHYKVDDINASCLKLGVNSPLDISVYGKAQKIDKNTALIGTECKLFLAKSDSNYGSVGKKLNGVKSVESAKLENAKCMQESVPMVCFSTGRYVAHDKPAPTSLAVRAAKAFLLLPGINQDLASRSE